MQSPGRIEKRMVADVVQPEVVVVGMWSAAAGDGEAADENRRLSRADFMSGENAALYYE
jgi:hypothetical protein